MPSHAHVDWRLRAWQLHPVYFGCWDEQNPAVPLEPASLGVPMVHRGAARSQEARPLPSPSPDLRPTAWTPSL
jgi:hypothetical protein